MGSLKQFVLFGLIFISMTVWGALERTLQIAYFGQHGTAFGSWVTSVLVTLVYLVGFVWIRKLPRPQPEPETAPRSFSLWLTLVGILFILIPLIDVRSVTQVLSAVQVPLLLRLLLAAVALTNLTAACLWRASNYQQWKAAGRR